MIYFIQEGQRGPIKVGYTIGKPEKRLQTLQTGHPSSLVLLGHIEGTEVHEKKIHQFLGFYRIRGEWFRAEELVIKFIWSLIMRLSKGLPACQRILE